MLLSLVCNVLCGVDYGCVQYVVVCSSMVVCSVELGLVWLGLLFSMVCTKECGGM